MSRMKLSISNIGWDAANDNTMYEMLREKGFDGVEIAPTRIFPENPYEKLEEAHSWSKSLRSEYDLQIPSMQSIWFGRQERIFSSVEERKSLIAYTKKAIDFAAAIDCKNLVFGCPKNRNMDNPEQMDIAIEFFKELGDYACEKGTCIGMEANPPMYNTNFINDTGAAIDLIKKVDSEGFLLNLDLGTIIANEENIDELIGNVKYINHVHISEPGLKPIENRELHGQLKSILESEAYHRFVSIEMGKVDDINNIEGKLDYIKKIFA